MEEEGYAGAFEDIRMATVTAEKRKTKAKARKAKGNNARIERAVRLLKKGAISRAGKALESKGLGTWTTLRYGDKRTTSTRTGSEESRSGHTPFSRRRSCS